MILQLELTLIQPRTAILLADQYALQRDPVPFEAELGIWFPNHLHHCTLFLLLFCPSHRFSNTIEQFPHFMLALAGLACVVEEGEQWFQQKGLGKDNGKQRKVVMEEEANIRLSTQKRAYYSTTILNAAQHCL